MSARRGTRLGLTRTWVAHHKQRLIYVLLAGSIVVAIGAAATGGFMLRHAANIERQSLRTQDLAAAAVQLQSYSVQAEADGVTKQLAADRRQALAATSTAFRSLVSNDDPESDRIEAAYFAYVRASSHAFGQATEGVRPPPAEQSQIDSELSRLESLIDTETQHQAQAIRVANPQARLAVLSAVVAAAILVALLIWQFRLERKAGRIDRDNAARSEALIRLRDEFVAGVSHELRSPLTSIIGYLDLLRDDESGTLTSDQLAFLSVVQRSVDRLHQLVGDLLLIAETKGSLALDIHEVDLDTIAANCVEAAQPTADAKQIQLTLSRGSVRRIQGDPNRLAQAMDNLVSNAIKFTPSGGRIAVRTELRDGHAVFEVTDTGFGVSPADQAQLFDRFFRTRVAIDQAIAGTGLGLTITKAIVDAHHGSITVESTLGEGSAFRVQLPAGDNAA